MPQQPGDIKSPSEQTDLLHTFRGQYGRLCGMVARALTQGHRQHAVIEAARGIGCREAPVYVAIRKQYTKTKVALRACYAAGITDDDVVRVAYDARAAVDEEWMIVLPAFSEARI